MTLPSEMAARVVTDRLAAVVAEFATIEPFRAFVDCEALLVIGVRGKSGPYGRHAACHFTAFRNTRTRRTHDGAFELPSITRGSQAIRYVISFTLPRFLELPAPEQAEVVMHELLHIDPRFDGAASGLRHGPAFDAAARHCAQRAREQGIAMPALTAMGSVLFRRFRPFPRAYRVHDARARRTFDAGELELAACNLRGCETIPRRPTHP